MKIHAHYAGGILCGQANAKNVPLFAFVKLNKNQCARCCKKIVQARAQQLQRSAP